MSYQPLTITSPVAVSGVPYAVTLDAAIKAALDEAGWNKLSVRLPDGTALAHGVENQTTGVVHFRIPTVAVGANVFNFHVDDGTAENKAGVPGADTLSYHTLGAGSTPDEDDHDDDPFDPYYPPGTSYDPPDQPYVPGGPYPVF